MIITLTLFASESCMILNASALIVSTLGYLLFLVRLGGLRLTVAPFVWASLVVLLLYGFALAGFLAAGGVAVMVLGVLLGAFALWRGALDGATLRAFNPGYLLFAVPFVLIYRAIPDDFLFLVWDELSFWAKSQRLIFDSAALLKADSPVSFKNYPPAQQLFQYYFTVWIGWSEKNVLFAQNVYVLCALMGALGALIARPVLAGVAFLTACMFIYFLHADYVTIYSDSLVAVCFAGCVAMALQPLERGYAGLPLLVSLCAFVLIKEVALIFAAVALAVVALNRICGEACAGGSAGPGIIRRGLGAMQTLAACALPVGATILTWRWYASGILPPPVDYGSPTLAAYANGQLASRLDVTLNAFAHGVFKPAYLESAAVPGGFGLSLAATVLLLAGLSIVATLLSPARGRIKSGLALLTLLAGFFAYLAFLLWTYLFYFTEYEGTRVASFDRYTMSYVLGWMVLVYGMLISALERWGDKIAIAVGLAGLAFVAFYAPNRLGADLRQIQVDQAALQKRQKALALSDEVRRHIRPGEKVYFIAQNTNGYEKHMFDYSMIPYPPSECWSVGAKYHDGDVWTCNQPLAALLRGYAWLAIYNADDRFWRDNAGLLPPGAVGNPTGVYRVVEDGGQVIRLYPVR